MGTSVPGRKLLFRERRPSSVSSVSFGLVTVPSGMVKVHRQVPSMPGAVRGGSVSAAKHGKAKSEKRSGRAIRESLFFTILWLVGNPPPRGRNAELQGDFLFIGVIAAAKAHVDAVTLILEREQRETTLPWP